METLEAFQTKIVEARTDLARIYLGISHHIEAKDAVAPIVDLAVELNHQGCLPYIYIVLGTHCYFINEDYKIGFGYLKKALDIAKTTNNYLQQYAAHLYAGNWLAINCEYEESIDHFYKALEIAELTKSIPMICIIKAVMSFENYFFRGDINLAYQTSMEAMEASSESDLRTKGFASVSFGISCYGKGFFDRAEKHLAEAVEYLTKFNEYLYRAFSSLYLGEIYLQTKQYKKAEFYYERGVSLIKEQKFMPGVIMTHELNLLRLKALDGSLKINIEKLLENHFRYEEKNALGWRTLFIAEIILRMDDQHMKEADEWINNAIQTNTQNGSKFYLAQSHALYSEFFKRQADLPKAREQMNKAIEIMKECGADGWVEKYEKELAAIA